MAKRFTISRKEHEARELETLVVALGKTPAEARAELDGRYPLTTQAAQQELRARGLDATDWRMEAYAQCRRRAGDPLRVVDRARLWSRRDIDDFAEDLEAGHHLTRDALYREAANGGAGITWAEERRLQEAGRLEREKDLAKRVGAKLHELQAALYGWGLDRRAGAWGWIRRNADSPEVDLSPVWDYWTEGQVANARQIIAGIREDPDFAGEVKRYREMERRRTKHRKASAADR